MQIGIFDSLRIFINPLGFFVRVEKDKASGKYGYSFCRELSNGDIKIISRSCPRIVGVEVVLLSIERVLKTIFIHGSRAYLQEGTYMFNHYNVLRPRRILSESEVLNKSRIEEIIFNLRAELAEGKVSEIVYKPDAINTYHFGTLVENSIKSESHIQ